MDKTLATTFFLLTYFLSCAVAQDAQDAVRKKPNILFVLMDDLGWNDVGFRDGQFHTPTIDDMYRNGVRFNRSYTPPNCGASRAALLSGIYPWRMGLQGNAINSRSSAAIPPSKVILPQKLKNDHGYQTHLVGKWHQGFCKASQTPTEREFDSFYGFYLTKQDHFTHVGKKDAYDFHNNKEVDRSVEGQYSTYIYTERTRKLIEEYKHSLELEPVGTKPFFILLSYAAVHGPNQVPQSYIDEHCSRISNPDRQKKCGMMAAVDEGLKNITDDLKELGLEDDVLIVFTSDDGGKTDEGSSNWPLRGAKRTLWEGGIRVNTFMYTKSKNILPKRKFTWKGLFYISDFYAMLVGLIEDDTSMKKIRKVTDSLNHWKFLKAGFCKASQTPTERGFDSFYGFYLTKQDHFTHVGKKDAYDFHNNKEVDRSVEGQYSTYIYTERTRKLIEEYKHSLELEPVGTKPFFILLSYAAVHGPNQVPQSYIDEHCSRISNPDRQKKCGMMAAVDEGLKNITDDLKELGMEDDVFIVFTSDDGGKTDEGSSNWPLRGAKRTLWEGGIRVNTFMYTKSENILPKRKFTWKGLFYISDFYATLVGLIEDDTSRKKIRKVTDSLNHWTFLKAGMIGRSHRRGFTYVDQSLGVAMARDRNLKLLHHQSRYPGWYNPPRGAEPIEEPSRGSLPEYQLFDIEQDPTETTNLVDLLPEEYKQMSNRLRKVASKAKNPIDVRLDSSPRQFDGVWSTGWCGKRNS